MIKNLTLELNHSVAKFNSIMLKLLNSYNINLRYISNKFYILKKNN